jgi:hypothetical protein
MVTAILSTPFQGEELIRDELAAAVIVVLGMAVGNMLFDPGE